MILKTVTSSQSLSHALYTRACALVVLHRRSRSAVAALGSLQLLEVLAVDVRLRHGLQLVVVDRLRLDQPVGHVLHERPVLGERGHGPVVRALHELLHLAVEDRLRVDRGRLDPAERVVARLPRHRRVAHRLHREAPLRDHPPRDGAHLLQVVGGARGHLVLAEDDLLRDAPAERDGELALEVALRVHAALEALLRGREEREAARAVGARHDGHLGHHVVVGREQRHRRVPRLVVGDQPLARGEGHARVLLHAHLQPISSLPLRAATMAASFIRLASEAPEKPMVRLAMMSRSSSLARGLPRTCTFRISRRPLTSGRSTGTRRSKRPGRTRAESSMSARLVAASTMTPELPSKPSISVRIWLSVCSRSSLPPPPLWPPPPQRAPPMASISSMKTMHGAFCLACSKRSRTREAPTPTNISTNSEPEAEMKGTPASPATARASSVLPVPGGPSITAPRGILAPSEEYLAGLLRNSTISMSSCFEPSQPATSLNVTPDSGSISIFDFDLPKFIGFIGPPPPPGRPPPPLRLCRKRRPPMITMGKARLARTPAIAPPADGSGGAWTANTTFLLVRSLIKLADSPGRSRLS